MIVLDASAVLELLLQTARGRALRDRVLDLDVTLHAPEVLDLEVLQVLRRYALTGELEPSRALEAVEDLSDLPIERYSHAMMAPRIWELRENLTAHDAAYVALAEVLRASLVTCDGHLARAPHRAEVELLPAP